MSSSPEPLPGSASTQTEQEKRIANVWQSYTEWSREPMLKECNFGGDIVDSIQTGEHDIGSRGVLELKKFVFR